MYSQVQRLSNISIERCFELLKYFIVGFKFTLSLILVTPGKCLYVCSSKPGTRYCKPEYAKSDNHH